VAATYRVTAIVGRIGRMAKDTRKTTTGDNEDLTKPSKPAPNDPLARPSRKQIRYYHHLLRKLDVPYEAANQLILLKFNTVEKMDVRIKELMLMVDYNELADQHKTDMPDLFKMLNFDIGKLRKESTEMRLVKDG
jgi:hypothetical protein